VFNSNQKKWLADKLGDVAAYAIGTVFIGQLINNRFNPALTIVGLSVVLLSLTIGYYSLKAK
jgi:uncharacterized membrane protein YphA (DoxX/SURF4 family)